MGSGRRQLVNSTGTVTDSYLYDSWGNILLTTGTTINAFRYTGKAGYYLDLDLGGYFLRRRFFDPATGRFLSRDPLGFGMQWQLRVFNSCSYPLYEFVFNNPANVTDPSGLAPCAAPPLGCPPSPANCAHYLSPGYTVCCAGTYYPVAEYMVCITVPAGGFSNCMRACLQRCEVAKRIFGCTLRFAYCHGSCGYGCATTPAAPPW